MPLLERLAKVCSDLFTEANNTVVDLKRVAAAAGVSTFCFAAIHSVVFNHQVVDFLALGGGVAAIVTAVGGSLALGSKAESDADPK